MLKSKPDRQKKMQDALAVLERNLNQLPGRVSLFLSLQEKSWMGVLECYPLADSESKQRGRTDEGFTVLHKVASTEQVRV